MNNTADARIAALERRQRLLLTTNALGLGALAVVAILQPGLSVRAQERPDTKSLKLSELAIVDNNGRVRIRLGGNLPDAVINGVTKPRGRKGRWNPSL
jgi:hypothetical protein